MEGFNWIRISAIAALVFGSIYVLLPSILQEDLESRIAARTAAMAPAPTKVDNDLEFDLGGGDADRVAKVLQERLKVAGVPTSLVEARDGRVRVVRGPGATEAAVERLASADPAITLHLSSVLPPIGEDPPEVPANLAAVLDGTGLSPADWGPRVAGAGNAMLPADAPRVESALGSVEVDADGVILGMLNGGIPEESGFLVLAVDGRVEALVAPVGQKVVVVPLPGVTDPDLGAMLAGGSLGAKLTRVPEPVADAPAGAAAPPAESPVPDWLLGMLPDTRLNLGLDLQGGVDLTLQIGLDEAVQGHVSRDAVRLKEGAKRTDVTVANVRADRARPLLWVESDQPLSAVTDLVQQQLGIDYVYSTSEGNRHGFEMAEQRQEQVKEQAIEQVLETLRKRVDATGVKEPTIVRKGGGQINVQLPGAVDLQAAVDAIGTTAVLEFRMVDEEFDDSVLEKILNAARDALPDDQFGDDATLNHWLWDTKRLADDRIVLYQYEEMPDGQKVRDYPLVLKNEVLLTGNDVNSARVSWDQTQRAYVGLDFKPRGARVFCDVTAANVGKRFGIILDGELKSAPKINEQICGGSAQITMGSVVDPLKDAENLALVLRTGSLDAPVDVGGVTTVGATLGADSIQQGTEAAVIGALAVFVFMALWYRTSGVLADVALAVNILLLVACLALFGATLTLPGIAGIALTVGMAVDANIIIFERIREELKLGIHPRKAVDVGFDKGVVAVLDANITTAIAGIVLYSYGTGPIKGFAVTMLVGIVTTLIAALFVTRTLMDIATRRSAARLRI